MVLPAILAFSNTEKPVTAMDHFNIQKQLKNWLNHSPMGTSCRFGNANGQAVAAAVAAAVDLEVEVAHEDHLHQGQQAHKQVDGCCHIIPKS